MAPAGASGASPAAPSGPAPSVAEQTEDARNLALRILTAAPKSRAQLAEQLARRGVEESVAAPLLDRFVEVGLLDDAELAGMIVRTRFAEKRQSRRVIALELGRKGIDPETAQRALEQIDDVDESEALLALARARLRRTAGLDRDTRIRRALGALGRKGYPPGAAMQSIRAVLAEESQAQDERSDDDVPGDVTHEDWDSSV